MNENLKGLKKLEFVVTYACTGRCKHCSEGEHAGCNGKIDTNAAVDVIRKVSAVYDIKTVMAFGGEPLLHPDTVYAIMRTAREMGVSVRQVITSGYFSKDSERINEVAKALCECGVNDLLLSVDAFHQETIPLDVVRTFAEALVKFGVPVRLQPAWLVSREDENAYNLRTREILDSFSDTGIPVGEGNTVFPEGNALKYLSEYFKNGAPSNPYVEDPYDVRCLSFDPSGDVLGGNIYRNGIMEIIENYAP